MINKNLDISVLRTQYQSHHPNYVVIENLFDIDLIMQCEKEFLNLSDDNFFKYCDPHFEYEKYAMNDVNKMPEKLRLIFDYIHSSEFIQFVSQITGLDNLYVDEKRWGGGLHKTKKDGYLAIHKDFNVLPSTYRDDKQYLRCINLIGYLTNELQENNNGQLEFWNDGCVQKILNKFNNWVIFDTRDNYHGHPYPFQGNKPRLSIASYYYLETKIDKEIWKSTEYVKLPWMGETPEYIQKRENRANPKLRYKIS